MLLKMESVFIRRLAFLCVTLLWILPAFTDGLTCYQCNVFIRGTPWPCDRDGGMATKDDCVSCLKQYTRTYLHNTFHDQLLTSYTSRVCVKSKEYNREPGCYSTTANGGYIKRCFCDTDHCNSGTRNGVTVMTSLVVAFISSVWKFIM